MLQIAVAEEEKSRKQSASSRFLVLLSLSLSLFLNFLCIKKLLMGPRCSNKYACQELINFIFWIMALSPSYSSFAVGSISDGGKMNPNCPLSRSSTANEYFTPKEPYT